MLMLAQVFAQMPDPEDLSEVPAAMAEFGVAMKMLL